MNSGRNRRTRTIIGVAIGAGAAAGAVGSAQAQDITVTNLMDAPAEGSLRNSIDFANAYPGADRILFQSSLSGSINLGGALPAITEKLEIVGPGPGVLTVNGLGIGNNFIADADTSISGLRVINGDQASGTAIRGSQGIDLDIDDMIFEDNTASGRGGAVYTRDGTLDLTDSTFTGNVAVTDGGGALYSYGTEVWISETTFTDNSAVAGGAVGGAVRIVGNNADTTIEGSTFTGNFSDTAGGGLHAVGPLKITDSEFRDNNSNSSGGLRSIGSASISGSLITDNTAQVYGGGIGLGGIEMDLNQRVPSSITNSTISGNTVKQAGAGIFSTRSILDLVSSTVTGNTVLDPPPGPVSAGGGVFQSFGTTNLSNSIVSANSQTDFGSTAQPPGPVSPAVGIFNGAFSLIGATTGINFNETVAGSNITSSAPELGPLADNGGPTQTMKPADSSPVVNKGKSALTVDQRGLVRPVDFNSIPFSAAAGANGADIGAVELQGGPLPPDPTCETDPALCPVVPPSNAFSFGKVKLNKKKGVATVQVRVPGAGRVLLLGSKTVAKTSSVAKGKATLNLKVKAKGKAAKKLKKKGHAKVKASFRFTPTGGTAKTKSKSVKLVKKQKKAGK